MALAVSAAYKALGLTSPNPAVGCALVQGERVVGLGTHWRAGAAHAEVDALNQAGPAAAGARAYVTLEPCNHHGRTGPCAEALIRAGISEVFVGVRDPNPRVAGGGCDALRAAGIPVTVGVAEQACRTLLAPFARAVTLGLPHVTLKVAATLDGRSADVSRQPRWITGPLAREHAHRLRERSDAIMVGVGTVLADDPSLTARPEFHAALRQPAPVVVDTWLQTPSAAKVARPGARIYCGIAAADHRESALAAMGAQVVRVPLEGDRVSLEAVLKDLVQQGHHRVLVEGGPTLASALLERRLVQSVLWYTAAALAGGEHGSALPRSLGVARIDRGLLLSTSQTRTLGSDVAVWAEVEYPSAPV
jgi:diaminohydroxyphosphoribosylaminopyrimidine deaminase/5-amino-6-(5-phosphoribosylamino)uracil reductase